MVNFLFADAQEFFAHYGTHKIYQTVVGLDPSSGWTITSLWRVQGVGEKTTEKNWVPVGTLNSNGHASS